MAQSCDRWSHLQAFFYGNFLMRVIRRSLLKSALALSCASAFLSTAPAAAQVPAKAAEPIELALIETMSGPFANTGEAVWRNLVWAVERVNARGGVKVAEGMRPLKLMRHDSKGQNEEALSALRAAIDGGARVVLQGNSSATALALVDAINKHNAREPGKQVLFLNYSAVEPSLTNERCSPWHFRFDAHANMRMAALMSVLKDDTSVKQVYLIGQDYSFGQAVAREARRQITSLRPDIQVVGDELHPMGRVKDFLPYAAKIKASGAQAVVTGNWGNDLTLLVKAAKEVGFDGKFYTFYGNALGAPAAIGDAGVGKVLAVAEWMPNVPGKASEALVTGFRQRYPNPADDYLHLRMQAMIELLAQAIERSGTTKTIAISQELARAGGTFFGQAMQMRAADHQLQQPLVVGVMERAGAPGVRFDVEGSGYGFKVVRQFSAAQAELPHQCQMPPAQ